MSPSERGNLIIRLIDESQGVNQVTGQEHPQYLQDLLLLAADTLAEPSRIVEQTTPKFSLGQEVQISDNDPNLVSEGTGYVEQMQWVDETSCWSYLIGGTDAGLRSLDAHRNDAGELWCNEFELTPARKGRTL